MPALILLLFACNLEAGKLYKWVDEDGIVRYSDRMPPQQIKQKHQTLNDQGIVVGTQEAARSPEELAAERAAAAILQQELDTKAAADEKLRLAQYNRDRVLLMTFGSVQELEHARENRFEVLNAVIRLINTSLQVTAEKLANLEATAQQQYISKNQRVPGGLAQNIEVFTRKRNNREEQLRIKTDEVIRLNEQFELDIARYRQLVNQ